MMQNILLIPEVRIKEANANDDYSVSKKIANLTRHPDRITIIDADHSPSELKEITGNCTLLISARFHMVIFALSMHVPSIAIAYIPKSFGIMEMIEQREYVIRHQDLSVDLLMEKVEQLWLNQAEIRRHLAKKMVHIELRARYAADLIKQLLEEKTQ
jgi:polysaccharide pyruvyl transferase WcaK-like protein